MKENEAISREKNIELYMPLELEWQTSAEGNPFIEMDLKCVFTHIESGSRLEIPGFYAGGGVTKIRFMPMETGAWEYRVESSDQRLDGQSGRFICTPAGIGNHGPVRVKDTFYLAHADGARHISIGTTCYAWVYQSGELIEETFEALKNSPFNKIRMCVFPKYYLYNLKEPERFPFLRKGDGFDYDQPDYEFFKHFDTVIERLMRMGIQADIILFHPYDKWGFKSMGRRADENYLKYMAARYAAYQNVWWSLANEYDLFTMDMSGIQIEEDSVFAKFGGPAVDKAEEDWDRLIQVVEKEDPYKHLRSIHYCMRMYDYTKPWVTHCSVQRMDCFKTAEYVTDWREQYQKPVVYDECAYEGNIDMGWGNITGENMTRRFWEGAVRGGYMGHGETYVHPEDILWWSHGGKLHGSSPQRIAFLKEILEQIPDNRNLEPFYGEFDVTKARVDEDYYIYYFGFFQPSFRKFRLPADKQYEVEVIDTWNMTVEKLEGTFSGKFTVPLPGREYIAVRMIRVK